MTKFFVACVRVTTSTHPKPIMEASYSSESLLSIYMLTECKNMYIYTRENLVFIPYVALAVYKGDTN